MADLERLLRAALARLDDDDALDALAAELVRRGRGAPRLVAYGVHDGPTERGPAGHGSADRWWTGRSPAGWGVGLPVLYSVRGTAAGVATRIRGAGIIDARVVRVAVTVLDEEEPSGPAIARPTADADLVLVADAPAPRQRGRR